MPDEITAWELVAKLTVQGDDTFKSKIEDATRTVEQSQSRVDRATSGGGAGGGGMGGNPAANAAPRYVGGGSAGYAGISGHDKAAQMLRDQGASDAEIIKFGLKPPSGGGFVGGPPPMGGGGGRSSGAPRLSSTMLMSDADKAQANALLKPSPGGGLVGKGPSDLSPGGLLDSLGKYSDTISKAPAVARGWLKNNEDMAKEIAAAKGSWSKYGLGIAYAARHVLSGGPAGIAGGLLGAGIGAIGGVYGGYLGSVAGSAVGEGVGNLMSASQTTIDKFGKFSPGAAYARQRAELNAEAAEGSNYREAYKRRTKLENDWADFYRSGGRSLGGEGSSYFGQAGTAISDTYRKWLAAAEGVNVVPGSGRGSAPSPLGGKTFSSIREAHRALTQLSVTTSGDAEAAMALTKPPRVYPPHQQRLQAMEAGMVRGFANPFTPEELAQARAVAGNNVASYSRNAAALKGRGDWNPVTPYRSGETPVLWGEGQGKGGWGPNDSDARGGNGPFDSGGKGLGSITEGFEPWQWLLYVATLK